MRQPSRLRARSERRTSKGFEFVADKGGQTDGLIRVNEMVAYKLPMASVQPVHA